MESAFRETTTAAGSDRQSASERFREAAPRRLAIGLVVSVGLHTAILGLLSLVGAVGVPARSETPGVVLLPPVETPDEAPPPAVRLPPPSPPVQRPGAPAPAPDASPAAAEPEWIPHDVPPRLLNPREVVELLERRSPAVEGDGERLVVLWMYVDRSGTVRRLRIRRSSGLAAVDGAARHVASSMRFRPALFQGRTVAVWIAQPIRFSLQLADGSGPGSTPPDQK